MVKYGIKYLCVCQYSYIFESSIIPHQIIGGFKKCARIRT